jgi:DNA-binding NarL/FixJ family response regulator
MRTERGSRSAPSLAGPKVSKSTRDLIRDLVNRARDIKKANGKAADPSRQADVLLDVEVDGVRCTLVNTELASKTPLSPRETAIARMIAEGYSNKAIATTLAISTFTVDTHVRRIFLKLGVRTRAAMATSVVSMGLFKTPAWRGNSCGGMDDRRLD